MSCNVHARAGEPSCGALWRAIDRPVLMECTARVDAAGKHRGDHTSCAPGGCLIAVWPKGRPGAEVTARVARVPMLGRIRLAPVSA